MNPKVSVVCLTHNHGKYISTALDSILCQNVDFEFEIIVCDDGSTDSTPEIVNLYFQKYPDIIVPIFNKQSLGATKCSVMAQKMARGEYIASCEGDDFWISSQKLKTQIKFLEDNPNYIGCVHKVVLVDENGVELKKQSLNWISKKRNFSISDFDGLHIPGHISTFVRRNIFLSDDFDGSIIENASKNIGDRTNFLLCLQFGDIHRIQGEMSAYRVIRNGNNLTSVIYVNNKSRTQNEFDYLIALEKYAKQNSIKVNFCHSKRELFVSAVLDVLRYHNQDNKECLKNIVCDAGKQKYGYYSYFIFGIIRRIIVRLFETR